FTERRANVLAAHHVVQGLAVVAQRVQTQASADKQRKHKESKHQDQAGSDLQVSEHGYTKHLDFSNAGLLFSPVAFDTLIGSHRTTTTPPRRRKPHRSVWSMSSETPGSWASDHDSLFDQCHLGAGHELFDIDQDEHAFAHRADARQVLSREGGAELRRGADL